MTGTCAVDDTQPKLTCRGMQAHHISVCICTFRREKLLGKLLARLEHQQTDNLFTYSVVVADNDSTRSAERVVAGFSCASRLHVTYCVEPQQNIALARNKALQHAEGDLIAFIDDDEFPEDQWLFNLFRALELYAADGVLGPVKPYFESDPPQWVKKGRFFERPSHLTGYNVTWPEARSGNMLFRRKILNAVDTPFRSEFGSAGEDIDFFRRMMEKGYAFIWCDEAVAHEVIPSLRCKRSYLLKRALLRGSNFPKHPTHRIRNVARSLIALPIYIMALPILAMFGQHLFLRYLISVVDHAARLLSFLGFHLVTQRET